MSASVPDATAEELKALGIPEGSYRFQPLSMMQRSAARRLTASFRDVPHFSLLSRIEVDRLTTAREARNAHPGVERATFNDLVIKAAALALAKVPEANVSFTEKGLAFHNTADIAFAVALPEGGLVTPILRDAGAKDVAAIARETKQLAERGRGRKLTPPEYFGGTFTISNLGMYGVASFTSILNPPQACILSVGRAERRLVLWDDQPHPATVLDVTLTCDHRAVDGATGARWLEAFRLLLEQPEDWIGAASAATDQLEGVSQAS
ncbi:Dihydrolipoyllysine-residue succinyltransferase component of 2-oxoglutarate dehydrogenase complex [Alphaproteobacteria bacterium SO-S41]|nr:Dihydrolipoyllysine-residue succinyltransferase component of 2-oxoglutarate dehydrogenase complex [Alphaproteobacteria bacterium SO-S41]